MAYKNFFAAKLYTDIGSSDNIITLDTAPSATSGRLVLEARNPSKREIIKYTGVSGNQITGVLRGQGGTTPTDHKKNALVEMNLTAEDIQDLYDAFLSFSASNNDWRTIANTLNTVASNGQRSYSLTFNSVDLSGTLSAGMRLRTQRTVAANTYMGGLLNGSSHYFTKVTPTSSLSTVTDNFTIMAYVQPTAYQVGWFAARYDAAGNNGFGLAMLVDGRVQVAVHNGGSANFRALSTNQSLPLNKKTHVTATWAAGTVSIYFDGVSVPLSAVVTSGTAPTTAGTGGDFSIGRKGAVNTEYFAGYISNVGIFNAVLAVGTVRQYLSFKLTGAETNCIGAWSLDNTGVNQQSAGTNDVTATGGVGYTNISPFTSQASGLPSAYDYSIIHQVTFAGGNTTLVVQVPEGCTIPTSGGITGTSYSGVKAPYGMPVNSNKWTIECLIRVQITQASPVTSTVYNPGNWQITAPIGEWVFSRQSLVDASRTTAGNVSVIQNISTSPSSVTNQNYQLQTYDYWTTLGSQQFIIKQLTRARISVATQTLYYAVVHTDQSGVAEIGYRNDLGQGDLILENAYL